jgi:hypothetical protein
VPEIGEHGTEMYFVLFLRGYGLDDQGSNPGRGKRDLSLSQKVHMGSGAHSAFFFFQWVPAVNGGGPEVAHSLSIRSQGPFRAVL